MQISQPVVYSGSSYSQKAIRVSDYVNLQSTLKRLRPIKNFPSNGGLTPPGADGQHGLIGRKSGAPPLFRAVFWDISA